MEESSYPTHRYQTPNIPDYSSIAERRRLSGPTLRRFFEVLRKWKVDIKDARLLLGGISGRRIKQLSIRPERRILNQDQLLRATSVIAIDRSLHNLLTRRQADKWARTQNRCLPGGTPLSNMIAGGPLALWEWQVRLEKQVSEQKTAGR